jgi:hypothetical protein
MYWLPLVLIMLAIALGAGAVYLLAGFAIQLAGKLVQCPRCSKRALQDRGGIRTFYPEPPPEGFSCTYHECANCGGWFTRWYPSRAWVKMTDDEVAQHKAIEQQTS